MLTQDILKSIVDYNPITGIFTNKVDRGRWGREKAGKVIGTLTNGYITIRINGVLYLAHRLAWLYVYGQWPRREIDHIDVEPSNNKINNLREATGSQNKQNSRKSHADSQTKILGVEVSHCGFYARICIKGKRIYLGHFKTAEEAHNAYLTKKREVHEFNTI